MALPDRVPPRLSLIAARLLQGLATPIVALLISTAGSLTDVDETPISFCNVLFVGNLCASVLLVITYGPRKVMGPLRGMPAGLILQVLLFAALSAVLSTLVFMALETTSVTNAVLLARLGPVLFAVSSALLVRQLLGTSEWMGFALVGVGVVAVVLRGSSFELARGDFLILASVVVYAAVTLMSKRLIPAIGLPTLVFVRNFVSAWIFFAIALILFGPHHFADAFHGPLWGIMVVYAAVVIVVGQLAWYRALGSLAPATVARWSVLSPLIAVFYAFVINGEHPSGAQLAGLVLVTVGLMVSNLGNFMPRGAPENPESSVAAT